MRWPLRRSGIVVSALVICLFPAGCEKSSGKLTGTVLRDKKPIPLSATGVVQVTLIPDVAPGTPFTTHIGRCNPDGTFEILDVKPGKYKVAIEVFDPNPQTDKLGGAFSAANTKITRDIDGKKPLEIDLSNP